MALGAGAADLLEVTLRQSVVPVGVGIAIGVLAGVLRNAGETARAEVLLAQFPAGSYGAPIALACFHLVCGEIDAAVDWAGKAVGERHPTFISWGVRPFEKLFRQAPGWPALLKMMNLAEVA